MSVAKIDGGVKCQWDTYNLEPKYHQWVISTPQESIFIHVEPNFKVEDEVNILTNGVDLKEEQRHEGKVSIECGEALTEESNYEKNKQKYEAPILLLKKN
jgi:hypothetical protein